MSTKPKPIEALAKHKIKPKIGVSVISDRLRIHINGILHISLDIRELVAIQSYKYGDYRFNIDFYCKTTLVDTWYTERDIWTDILNKLQDVAII